MSREQNRNYLLTAHNSRLTAPSAATAELPPYLVLLRVGFALPATLLPRRCALTAPFHPYLAETRRYVFCGTFRQPALTLASRTLSGTPLCGVRTFLPRHLTRQERPSGPAAYLNIIDIRLRRLLFPLLPHLLGGLFSEKNIDRVLRPANRKR